MSSHSTTRHSVVQAVAAPAVRCLALVKRYDDLTAVGGLDLEVRKGECFGLLGPNGAGKVPGDLPISAFPRPRLAFVSI